MTTITEEYKAKNQYTITLYNDVTQKMCELVLQTYTAFDALQKAQIFAREKNLSIPTIDGEPLIVRYDVNGDVRVIF